MKIFFAFSLFTCVSCYAVFMPLAAADGGKARHTPTDKVLEFSLSRLKESARKTMQINDRLAFENEALRRNIEELQRMRDAFAAGEAGLSGEPPSSSRRQKAARFMETADIKKREQRTLELITVFERDITRLKERIRVLEDRQNAKEFDAKRRALSEKKEDSRKNLSLAEKKLKSLKKKSMAPLRTIEALYKKQHALRQKISALEGGRKRF